MKCLLLTFTLFYKNKAAVLKVSGNICITNFANNKRYKFNAIPLHYKLSFLCSLYKC